MIATTLLYKHIKNFVLSDKVRETPKMNNIYFNGEKVYATDGKVLAIVKNYPGEPGYVDIKGRKVEIESGEPINYTKVLVPDDGAIWTYTNKDFVVEPWITSMEFIVKLGPKKDLAPLVMEWKDEKMTVYTVWDSVKAAIQLPINAEDVEGAGWSSGHTATKLLYIFKFIKDTEQHSLTVRVSKAPHVMMLETEDMIFCLAPLLELTGRMIAIRNFMSENTKPDDNEYLD